MCIVQHGAMCTGRRRAARRLAWEEGSMKHLRVANRTSETANATPASLLCYIFIDWGSCGSVDQCGFDIGDCTTRDVCLVDY